MALFSPHDNSMLISILAGEITIFLWFPHEWLVMTSDKLYPCYTSQFIPRFPKLFHRFPKIFHRFSQDFHGFPHVFFMVFPHPMDFQLLERHGPVQGHCDDAAAGHSIALEGGRGWENHGKIHGKIWRNHREHVGNYVEKSWSIREWLWILAMYNTVLPKIVPMPQLSVLGMDHLVVFFQPATIR